MNIIFIAGAPGTGKSTIAKLLQEKLRSPCFEFGWIPEFRFTGEKEIPYEEEEGIAFENLTLVLKNYAKHGFKNIIVTDLDDKRIPELQTVFAGYEYRLITLILSDEEELKKRVLDETRSSGYRDWETALKIQKRILVRPLLSNEIRIDVSRKDRGTVLKEVEANI